MRSGAMLANLKQRTTMLKKRVGDIFYPPIANPNKDRLDQIEPRIALSEIRLERLEQYIEVIDSIIPEVSLRVRKKREGKDEPKAKV